MVRAHWNGRLIAESDDTVTIEGNHYFPPESLHRTYFEPSATRTTCPWKGQAHYYTLNVDGATNADAAWYYPSPKPAAVAIGGRVAFWKGVTVTTA